MSWLKGALRLCLIVVLVCWQLVVINGLQTTGGALWPNDEISQKLLVSCLFYAPLLAYCLCWLIVSAPTKIWMIFVPILFLLIGFPLLGLTWGGLSSVSYKLAQLCALYEMQLVETKAVDARSKICTYESIRENWSLEHKLKIVRRETQLAPGLAWVRNLPETGVRD